MPRRSDLILAILASLFAYLFTNIQVDELYLVKVLLGVSMALFVPGYVLFEALFPLRNGMRLERLVFSIGLSLAFSAITGIVLFVLRVSIRAETVAFVLLIATCVLAVLGAWRRRKSFPSQSWANSDADVSHVTKPQRRLIFMNAVLAAGAFVLTIIAFRIASLPTTHAGFEGYTTLWLIPQTKQIAMTYGMDAPSNNIVELGFTSQEFNTTTFNMEMIIDGKVVRKWADIRLVPGETWSKQLRLPANLPPNKEVKAQLFKVENSNVVYRSVVVRNLAGVFDDARKVP